MTKMSGTPSRILTFLHVETPFPGKLETKRPSVVRYITAVALKFQTKKFWFLKKKKVRNSTKYFKRGGTSQGEKGKGARSTFPVEGRRRRSIDSNPPPRMTADRRSSCPCKTHPMVAILFTAAEFGEVNSLLTRRQVWTRQVSAGEVC